MELTPMEWRTLRPLAVLVVPEGEGFRALVPKLPGLESRGRTRTEVWEDLERLAEEVGVPPTLLEEED